MRVRLETDAAAVVAVEEVLLAVGAIRSEKDWRFALAVDGAPFDASFPSGEVCIVVTDDENRADAFPEAGSVLVWRGDATALERELCAAIRLVRQVRAASPYRRLLDECPLPIVVKSAVGDVLYSNAATRRTPGVGVTEHVEEWKRPVDADEVTDGFVTPRERGYRKTTSAETKLGAGHTVVMDVVTDISMDHAVREELTQELGLMRGLLDSLPSLVLVTDENDSIVMLNPTLSRVLGQEREQLVGACMDDAVPFQSLTTWRTACAEARATGLEVRYESESLAADGTVRAYNGTTRATFGPSGESWIMTVAVDVSELRQTQRDAERATVAATEASRIKSQFLANMSHEIRTPMNGVLGMLDLALGTSLTTEQHEYLEAAHMSADSLLTIINDILDISKIEAGRLTLEAIPFSPSEVANGLATLKSRAREKGLNTSVKLDPQVPDRVLGDPVRFRQILVNLLGNAIKFTHEGSVDVRVFLETAGSSLLHVTVTDTGIGIPADQIANVFDAFRQADGTTTRRFGGTGLGLSICRELVTLMGGKLWVESEPGVGSTFHFTAHLPESDAPMSVARPAREPVAGPSAAKPTRRARVLIAEDNPVGAKVAVRMLELLGCETSHAKNGQEALDAAKTGAFDLVLMDMQMPVMDGLEATSKIRAWEHAHGKGRLPIVALTANAMKGDADLCLAAGMDGHLAKPIERDLLRRVIESMTADIALPLAEPAPPPPPKDDRPPAVNYVKALERCGNDVELLIDVAAAYDESVRENATALDEAMKKQDGAAVHHAAHTLKGVFAYVCADRAAAFAQEICVAGRAGELGHVPALVEALREECERVREALAHIPSFDKAPAA